MCGKWVVPIVVFVVLHNNLGCDIGGELILQSLVELVNVLCLPCVRCLIVSSVSLNICCDKVPIIIKQDNMDYVIVWYCQYALRFMVILSHLLDPLCYSFNTNRARIRSSSGDYASHFMWYRYVCNWVVRWMLTFRFHCPLHDHTCPSGIACTWKFPPPWCEVSFKEVRHHVITSLSTWNQYLMAYFGVLIEPINFLIHLF